MTKTHPFDQTMNELFRKLEAAVTQRQEADIQITANAAAIRGLANACEDADVKGDYLLRLEELSGKPGFKDVVLSILRTHRKGLTPTEIRSWISLGKRMELSGYSNPLASIHTTLRRMEGREVEEFQNEKGEKAYRLRPEIDYAAIAKAFAARDPVRNPAGRNPATTPGELKRRVEALLPKKK